MKEIRYTKSALRTLRKVPANTSSLIRTKIEAFASNPAAPNNNIKALKGREGVRLRVGDWRVIMDNQGNVLAVLEIGHRSSVYD
ncbi:plasmid stabilization system [Roseobacter sp. AzwK-3b]|uniref:type II toxin-antitoxin system RelE family toxin n=1 Tax=Roseobacter sp. AzwK-3b TaxID=351016 RepID=UPI000156A1B9|nr:type II toxin-antitoxin system RelE/ParE family toxin [Roseobacter sp. AzwK-3b]EDM69394.1 plasmid stabilization system [Roseobacter sp. AzwK-3b]